METGPVCDSLGARLTKRRNPSPWLMSRFTPVQLHLQNSYEGKKRTAVR